MDAPFRLESEPACRPKRRRKQAKRPAMPWGKYKGVFLDQVPLDYLIWLDDRCKLPAYLRRQVQAEIVAWNGREVLC